MDYAEYTKLGDEARWKFAASQVIAVVTGRGQSVLDDATVRDDALSQGLASTLLRKGKGTTSAGSYLSKSPQKLSKSKQKTVKGQRRA